MIDLQTRLAQFESQLNRFIYRVKKIHGKAEECSVETKRSLYEITQIFDKIVKRMESWEETLLYLSHNIKKNQYLYSHYPDEWVNNYLDIKRGLKGENNWMGALKVCDLQIPDRISAIESTRRQYLEEIKNASQSTVA